MDAVSAAIISYLWERRKDDYRKDEANWSQDPVEALLEEVEAQSLAWIKRNQPGAMTLDWFPIKQGRPSSKVISRTGEETAKPPNANQDPLELHKSVPSHLASGISR